jgi:hypothetical protein
MDGIRCTYFVRVVVVTSRWGAGRMMCEIWGCRKLGGGGIEYKKNLILAYLKAKPWGIFPIA